MADNEVKTKLTLEDGASQPLDKVEDKVEDVEQAEKKAQDGLKEWAQTAAHAAQAIGVNLSDVVGKVKEFGSSFVEAGRKAEGGDVAVAALVSTTQGKSWDESIAKAESLGDAIDEIGIGAGISGDALGDAFQVLLEVTGATEKGIDNSVVQLENMAQIASKLGKDVGGIAREYSFMAEGQLKVKGQLFQLLQSTGIFGTDTKKAVEAWSKLSEEKRIELLNFGMKKLGGEIAKMPTTFNDASDSLGNMVRITKETIGQPLIEELTPALGELTDMLQDLQPEVKELASAMAKDVAQAVRSGGKELKEAVLWLREHKDEIAQGFREGAEAVRKVITFILDHKEELALALGAKAGSGILSAAKPAASAFGAGTSVIKKGLIASEMFVGTQAEATIASLGALGAAIAALGLIAYAEYQVYEDMKDRADTRQGGMKELMRLAEAGDLENVRNTVNTMKQLDEAAGRLDDKMKKFYETVLSTAEAANRNKAGESDALRRQIEIASAAISDTYAKSIGDQSAAGAAWAANMTQNQLVILVNAYNQAAKNNDTAMMQLAASTIAGSGLVGEAFLKSSMQIEGGFSQMADVLMNAGSGFGAFISQLRGKGPTAPKAPTLNLNGGQTFNIKQDFRQQDPDRVAILFRRDVARMAGRTLQSKFAGPFGG